MEHFVSNLHASLSAVQMSCLKLNSSYNNSVESLCYSCGNPSYYRGLIHSSFSYVRGWTLLVIIIISLPEYGQVSPSFCILYSLTYSTDCGLMTFS